MAFIRPLRFKLVRSTRFSLQWTLVSRYTNSTLVAEPGRPGLPTCALATTSSSSQLRPAARLALVVQPDRQSPLSLRTASRRQAAGIGIELSQDGTSFLDLRDSYAPLFSGQPADYREWRERIQLYHAPEDVLDQAVK